MGNILTRHITHVPSSWIWSDEQYMVSVTHFEIKSADKPVLTLPICSPSARSSCLRHYSWCSKTQKCKEREYKAERRYYLIAHVVYIQPHVPVLIKNISRTIHGWTIHNHKTLKRENVILQSVKLPMYLSSSSPHNFMNVLTKQLNENETATVFLLKA